MAISRIRLAAAGGHLEASGRAALAAPRRFELIGALTNFNPAAFGAFPPAGINARLGLSGQLLPRPSGDLGFSLGRSHFRNHPLSGSGYLRLTTDHLVDSDLTLVLADNRLRLNGSYGASGDRLRWWLEAPNPQIVSARLGGRLLAQGTLAGRLTEPSGDFRVDGSGVRWGESFRVAALHAEGRLDGGRNGPLQVKGNLQGFQAGKVTLARAELSGSGQRATQQLALRVHGTALHWGETYGVQTVRAEGQMDGGLEGALQLDANLEGIRLAEITLAAARVSGSGRRSRHELALRIRDPDYPAHVTLVGGWNDGWSGEITRLDHPGRYPLHLLQPARLDLGRDRVRLQQALFTFLGGRFALQDFDRQGEALTSQGRFDGVPAARVLALLPQPAGLTGDLGLAGTWNIRVQDSVDGRVAVWREAGDLASATEPRIELGLSRLRLDLKAEANRFQGELDASGERLGELEGRLQTAFSRRGGQWGLAAETPLAGTVTLDLPDLAWLAPLLDQSRATRFNAKVAAHLSVTGRVGRPELAGNLRGDGLRLEWPEAGLYLHGGWLRAVLRQDRLELSEFVLQGGKGRLTAKGDLSWAAGTPRLDLTGTAGQLEVLARPDRRLALSGNGEITLVGKAVNLKGTLQADRAFIELPRTNAPVRSDDVVVLGRPEAPPRSSPFAVNLDLQLDLGERFLLVGRGMDVQLGGKLRVSALPRAYPRLSGSVRVVKGRYSAYGQSLQIERGVLDFHGPLDNPGLDILAMRKNQPVEAGVLISGSARAPQATLVSNPLVPDSEKLAWLVLGRGTDTANASDLDILSAAAGALLSAGQSVSLQTRIAEVAGLDEIGMRGAGELERTVLTMGKRLSAKAYVSYEQGLTGVDNLLKFNYTLSRRLSVQAQTGREHAVDLLYTFSFD